MNPEYPFQPGQQPPQVPQQPQGQFAVPGGTQPQTGFQPGGTALPPVQPYGPVTPVGPPAGPARPSREYNPALKWIILTFVFVFTTLSVGGLSIWLYTQYRDYKDNSDSKVAIAVAAAVKDQADKDAADFLEKEKAPNRQFVGPDDYGRLSFDYPKTWSVYVAEDASDGGNYEAYFNPGTVPSTDSPQFALRVIIEETSYDDVLSQYQSQVEVGELKSSSVQADEQNGTRLDGIFSEDVHGSAVIFKIRDKTVTIQTDAQTFIGDFNALIKTITFNK